MTEYAIHHPHMQRSELHERMHRCARHARRRMHEFGFGRSDIARGRAGRGDIRAAILALLAEEPMHGYQIMRELNERSGGAWRVSPGSVYPTLSQLEDEELVQAEQQGGKRVFSLTDAGTVQTAAPAAATTMPRRSTPRIPMSRCYAGFGWCARVFLSCISRYIVIEHATSERKEVNQ